jgi:hypothetical protein
MKELDTTLMYEILGRYHAILYQCCQLFAELFGQSKRKIWPMRGKKLDPSNFNFLNEFGLKKNTIFVYVSGKISWTSLELERI